MTDYDRPISVALARPEEREEEWEGQYELAVLNEDIVFLPSVIPANSDRGILRVQLNNSERIKRGRTLAMLMLPENEHFSNTFRFTGRTGGGMIFYDIFVENALGRPVLWAVNQDGVNNIELFDIMFGPFGNVKYEVMMRAIGFDRDFLNLQVREDGELETLPEAWERTGLNFQTMILWARLTNQYLDAYRFENGVAMRDENGNEVEMGRTGRNFRSAGM
jgi:hypothetical protein